MSYILDALKKSEREKTLGQVPTLETVISDGAKKQPKGTPWWVNLLVFLVVLLAVLVGMYFAGLINFDSKKDSFPASSSSNQNVQVEEQAAQQTVSSQSAAVVEQESQQPAPTQAAESVINENVVEQVQQQNIQPATVAEPEIQQAAVNTAAADQATKIEEITSAQAQAQQQAQQQEKELATPEQVEVVEAQVPVQQAEPAVKQTVETEQVATEQTQNASYEEALHQNLRNIAVNVVSYSSDARQRFVMLDLTIYKEGDSLPNDAEIVEIMRTGAIVSFQNKRYLLKP